MKIHLKKWGNSLALRIPESFASEIGLERESTVEVFLADGTLVIKPVSKPDFTLKQLLSKVTAENIHPEIKTGLVIGKKSW